MIKKRLNKTGDTAIEKQQQKYSTSLEKRHPMAFVVQILALRSPETVPLKKNYVGSSSFLACFLITGLNLPVKFLRAAWRGGEEGGAPCRVPIQTNYVLCQPLSIIGANFLAREIQKLSNTPHTHTHICTRMPSFQSKRWEGGEGCILNNESEY